MTASSDARLVQALTPRDRDILDSLERFRLLSSTLIRQLHFGDHHGKDDGARATNRVMSRLEKLHLVSRLDQRIGGFQGGSSSLTWQLSLSGHRLQAALTGRPQRSPLPASSWLFAQHTLGVAEVAVGLVRAERAGDFEVLRLDTEPACWQEFLSLTGVVQHLKPDLYVVTANAAFEEHSFVEVDLGTEHRPTLQRKAKAYGRYRASGRHEAAHGVFPRVIWVVPDQRRRRAVEAALAPVEAEQGRLHAVATFADLPDLLAPHPPPEGAEPDHDSTEHPQKGGTP